MSLNTRMLIVDDEPEILELLTLTFRGFSTETALDSESALELLRARPFDVLVTDVRMPGASGLSLIDHARASSPGILIFVMTGHYQEVPRDIQDKVSRWILKPFTVASLRKSVYEALEARK